MQGLHIVHYIMDQKAKNPLFYSPISDAPQNILDIGTGTGIVSMSLLFKSYFRADDAEVGNGRSR